MLPSVSVDCASAGKAYPSASAHAAGVSLARSIILPLANVNSDVGPTNDTVGSRRTLPV